MLKWWIRYRISRLQARYLKNKDMSYYEYIEKVKKLRKLLVIPFIIFFASSCSPEYYIAKYCPVVSDSTFTHQIDTVIQHDTVLKVEERILTVHDTVPCDDFTIERDSGGVGVTISVTNGVLRADCKCDSVEIKFHWSELRRTITTHREITRAVYRNKKDSWFKHWETWAVISGLLFLLIIKILKLTKKWPLPFP